MTAAVSITIARRVAGHLHDGEIVNLGIGIPTAVADQLPPGVDVVLQTENGMLGVGPTPLPDDVDANLINAGKQPVTERVGASYFSSSSSFAMIRGSHVDVAVLGGLQVDERGLLANWSLPGRPILGIGGAMDLVVGARRVIAAMTHLTRSGEPKIVRECSFPITADRRIDLVVTEHATFAIDDDGMRLIDIAPESSLAWVEANTEARFAVSLDAKA